jgi:AraC family transcriptional regulator
MIDGHFTTLARSPLVTMSSFRHADAPHRDPPEERFDRPTAIFTTRGRWQLAGAFGRVDAEAGVVTLGHAGESYRCHHHERCPSDRTVFVSVDHERLGYDPLPRRGAVAATPESLHLLERLRRADDPLATDAYALALLGSLRGDAPRRARATPVDAARDLLDASVGRPVTLLELSREVHVSPFHLHRRFREAVGVSPHEYLLRRRLERAQELLADGASVTEVAAATGFSSPGYFSTVFRRRVGVTPTAFRDGASPPRTAAPPPPR